MNLKSQAHTTISAATAAYLALRPSPAFANIQEMTGNRLADGVLSTIIYSLIGILMAFLSYRVIDAFLPGNLSEQLTTEKNVAVGIVAGAMMLGVCIIIAATLVG